MKPEEEGQKKREWASEVRAAGSEASRSKPQRTSKALHEAEMKGPRESPAVAESIVDGASPAAAVAPAAGADEERAGEGDQGVQLRREAQGEPARTVVEGEGGRPQTVEPAEEGDDDGEQQEEEEEEEEERPKLDEGFYEIEDIRKTRVVKGQRQYLIKWRGWPETANTWEPYDNIQSCGDIIHSFEERSKSHPRKRKRKSSGFGTFTKKKQQPRFRIATSVNKGYVSAEGKEAGESNTGRSTEPCTDEKVVVAHGTKVDNANDVREPRGTEESAAGDLAVHLHTLEEDGTTDALSNVKCSQPLQGGSSFTGARRRKSTRVKRFDPSEAQQGITAVNENGSHVREKGMEYVNSGADEITKEKVDDGSTNPNSVAKILMPVEFSTSMSNNIQDVSVTFKALRSDGREVLVNNKALKVTNPLLLINFYEQHLRYGQP